LVEAASHDWINRTIKKSFGTLGEVARPYGTLYTHPPRELRLKKTKLVFYAICPSSLEIAQCLQCIIDELELALGYEEPPEGLAQVSGRHRSVTRLLVMFDCTA
jgi:hypothetical protein